MCISSFFQKKLVGLLMCVAFSTSLLQAQTHPPFPQRSNDDALRIYRATPTVVNDLVHTKLDITPIFESQQVNGKAWITLKPHFHATDSLTLDAKYMSILSVSLVEAGKIKPKELPYTYKKNKLRITLPRLFKRSEKYTVYIEYVAKPEEVPVKGSAAISSDKGFYFINPLGKQKNKITELWTQGETEASSCWFPTIDKPNQKTTQELAITIPAEFVSLSNGTLVRKLSRGKLRTDYWVLDKPHAPYLFFVGAGPFSVVKDSYKGMPVDYYVEKEYASVAKQIFGMTPDMIAFFESILGVKYPWPKYAQMVARNFVSGAMENTSATLHADHAYQNARQLKDGNRWEDVIAHELFHHWFGDLVTTESWSNLTLNESFANYSEYLWNEHRYGKDAAEYVWTKHVAGYIRNPKNKEKHLVRFYYEDKEDMFDGVSYNKGGAILHMLRQYLGDEVFFAGLNHYLNTYTYKNAEAHNLRMSLEEVSGEDLNWFFNQWYYGSGHPIVQIYYTNQPNKKSVQVAVVQESPVFQLPCPIAVHYADGSIQRSKRMLKKATEVIDIPYDAQGRAPVWISVDETNSWLAQKTDRLSFDALLYQLEHGGYIDASESINQLKSSFASDASVRKAFFAKLSNASSFHRTQSELLNYIQKFATSPLLQETEWKQLMDLADNSTGKVHPLVQADALSILIASKQGKKYAPLFKKHVMDSSYSVAGMAFYGLYQADSASALQYLPTLQKDAKGDLLMSLVMVISDHPNKAAVDFVLNGPLEEDALLGVQFTFFSRSLELLSETTNVALGKACIDGLYAFSQQPPKEELGRLHTEIDALKKANVSGAKNPTLKGELLNYFQKKFNL